MKKNRCAFGFFVENLTVEFDGISNSEINCFRAHRILKREDKESGSGLDPASGQQYPRVGAGLRSGVDNPPWFCAGTHMGGDVCRALLQVSFFNFSENIVPPRKKKLPAGTFLGL